VRYALVQKLLDSLGQDRQQLLYHGLAPMEMSHQIAALQQTGKENRKPMNKD
jgi:hypothetical protein